MSEQTVAARTSREHGRRAKIMMFDPLATVPYYTAYIAQALIHTGADLQIASITYYLDPTCFSSRALPLRPGCLDVVGRFHLARGPRRIFKLLELGVNLLALSARALFRAPDVLHIQFLPLLRGPAPLDLWFARLCKLRGARLVLTVHDLLPHDTAERFHAVFQQLYTRMDALICHSDHIKGRLQREFGIEEGRIAVIPHGPFFYDLPAATPMGAAQAEVGLPSGEQIVLWQGIIFPYKGLDLLLEAWQQVEVTSTTAHLVVMGTGDPALLAKLHEQIQQLGLKRVRLHLRFVSTEELVGAYRAADVVVYPYRAITTSGAIATGLALGKAIVATDLPVFRELLEDGETALLVPPGDPMHLSKAILRLLQDQTLRQTLEANVAAMNFGAASWRAIAQKTWTVYDAVLQAHSPVSLSKHHL